MNSIKLVTINLYEELLEGLTSARSIHILTSFVMKSGVDVLAPHLKAAAERGTEIQVCTGDYLFVTQPEALRKLFSIHQNISVRLFKSNGKSFHPKAYLFDIPEEHGYFIVGSSNLSRSALKTGTEWNLSLAESVSPETYLEALDQFQKTFLHDQTIPVNKETLEEYQLQYKRYHQKHPNLVRTWTEAEEQEMTLPKVETAQEPEIIVDPAESYIITPRPSQQEALELLQNTHEEGYDKAMVVMATGLGKTYLAGFFAQNFKRILFIAHREEILKQAKQSFQHIMPDQTYGLYYGTEKQPEADVIFASIYTLGMKRHLEVFSPDDFDLIVVDEFHHAAAQSYHRVIDYFKPKFLLGITATPDRMDGKDVYAICDGNVAYQIHFIEAIQKQWLAPFHYYGVYDDTDYRQITWLGTKYDEEELLAVQITEEILEKVYAAWAEHKQTKTISFCSSIRQANTLANYFNTKGVRAVSLNSRTVDFSRGVAIQQLNDGQLDIIFTVDLFNEGVDIPSVDTLLFVRPTESLTVFTQQVGRGLRLHNAKTHCVIIDLIGNYRNADVKMQLFNTELVKEKGPVNIIPSVPEGCLIDFDIKVIDLLKELQAKKQPRKEKLFNAYHELKRELGKRPTYLEIHLNGKAPSQEYKQEFKSYVGFLYWAGELSEFEKKSFKKAENWLIEVESTVMRKSYKMVLLKYMLSRGINDWQVPVTPEQVAKYFHQYLTEFDYRVKKDFSDDSSKKKWEYNHADITNLIAKMPMTMWSSRSKDNVLFQGNLFSLNIRFEASVNEMVFNWTKEICEYRLHLHFERKVKR
jgi:superfamily II DNA or RNA helicase/HKD family nuclease